MFEVTHLKIIQYITLSALLQRPGLKNNQSKDVKSKCENQVPGWRWWRKYECSNLLVLCSDVPGHGAMARPCSGSAWRSEELSQLVAKTANLMPVSAVTGRVCEKSRAPHHLTPWIAAVSHGFPANFFSGNPHEIPKNPEVFPAAWAWKPRFGETRPVGMISVAA